MARGLHQSHEVSSRSHRRRLALWPEQVKVAPADGADEAQLPAFAVGQYDAVAFQHRPAEALRQRAQRRPGFIELAAVEFVVAGDKQHRYRPAGKTLEAGPAGVDVAGQHQQVGVGRRLWLEVLAFEMQVGKQLQLQGAAGRVRLQAASLAAMRARVAGSSAGSPWASCLNSSACSASSCCQSA